MKKIILSFMTIVALSALQANAFDFTSALNFLNKAAETQANATETITTFSDIENRMKSIDSSVQTAFLNIVSELSTRKETKTIKNEIKSNTENLSSIISAYTSTLANNRENISKTISKLSSKDKTKLAENIATLTQSSQQYFMLATDGVKTAANTLKAAQKMNDVATTLTNINKTATELKKRATTVVNFANQIKSIASAAGLTVQ